MVEKLTKKTPDGTISQTIVNRQPVTEIVSQIKVINIVVNPSFIKGTAEFGNTEAEAALRIISEFQQADSREVDIPYGTVVRPGSLLDNLHLDIPSPAPNLKVNVCGVKTDVSNVLFLFELRKKGYKARFHPQASCTGRTQPPQTMINHILDMFPDFFD